jgi:hypothetical protein
MEGHHRVLTRNAKIRFVFYKQLLTTDRELLDGDKSGGKGPADVSAVIHRMLNRGLQQVQVAPHWKSG